MGQCLSAVTAGAGGCKRTPAATGRGRMNAGVSSGVLAAVLAAELVHASGRVHDLLLAREEGMA